MPFYALQEMTPARPAEGVERRSVYLEELMLTFFHMEAGAVVPLHNHPHEQISYVIEGAMEFTLGEQTRVLRAGEGAMIPSGESHSAVALEPTRVMDGWYPMREDYK